MNILFATTSKFFETGGIQEYNRNLLKALDGLGILAFGIELQKPNLVNKALFSLKMFFQSLKNKSDIIFCSHVNLSPLCFILKKIFNIKYVVFTHGTDVWELKSRIKIKALKEAEFVVTVSIYSKNRILQQIPELKSKIYLLPNTIDSKRFYPKKKSKELMEKYGLKGKKVIFTLARLSRIKEYKGYDKIIKSLPRILKEVPETVYILGGKGDSLEAIRNLINKVGLNRNIITPGFISNEDRIDYYNLADVYVMPSKKEGFGIVFLEALACGIPVIAGNQDGSSEPLLKGKLGFMVNPDDDNELAQKIISVLKGDVEDKNKINGDYLKKEIIRNFGFDQFQKKLKTLIDELQR